MFPQFSLTGMVTSNVIMSVDNIYAVAKFKTMSELSFARILLILMVVYAVFIVPFSTLVIWLRPAFEVRTNTSCLNSNDVVVQLFQLSSFDSLPYCELAIFNEPISTLIFYALTLSIVLGSFLSFRWCQRNTKVLLGIE